MQQRTHYDGEDPDLTGQIGQHDQALVVLVDGRRYSGVVEVAGQYIRCRGRRRVGGGDEVTFRALGEWCFAWHQVREVRRLDEVAA